MKKLFAKIFIFVFILGMVFSPMVGETTKTNAQAKADGWYFQIKNQFHLPNDPTSKEFDEVGPHATQLECSQISTAQGGGSCYEVKNNQTQGDSLTDESIEQQSQQQSQNEQARRDALNQNSDGIDFGCFTFTSFSLKGCVAGFFYIIFEVVAAVVSFVATILDFFIYYSLNSSSYDNDFIAIAWGSVRDIANIAFIIALLYASIQTILGLGAGKKIIANIVIIALLINFSLFVSQVVVDTSNILAKIFYNNMDAKEKTGAVATGQAGQKSITEALVSTFNPQNVFNQEQYEGNEGNFIFVTIILIALVGYLLYIFLIVSLLFVGRVAYLWLYMIFSPIAFASYVLPFNIPSLGYKEWWENILKYSFMAPVFIFLLYVILLLKPAFNTIANAPTGSTGILDTLMKVVIPAALMFFLLARAKDIAIKMSGELGAKLAQVGGMVAGLAGLAAGGAAGLAIGGVGMAGRRIGGRLGEKVQGWGSENGNWAQRGLYGAGKKMSTGSWDPRAVSIGGKSLANVGVVGKGQQGGWDKMKEDKDKRHQARAKELAEKASEETKKKKDNADIKVKDIETENAAELKTLDKAIEKAREELKEAPTEAAKIMAKAVLDAAKQNKETRENAMGLSDARKEAQKLEYNIKITEKRTKQDYADKIVNKAWAWTGAKERREETANKIRLGGSDKKDDKK
jgi:hypothetical protein